LIDEDAGYHFRPGREYPKLAQQGGTVVVDVYEGELAPFYPHRFSDRELEFASASPMPLPAGYLSLELSTLC
jgi:hypothetical protein